MLKPETFNVASTGPDKCFELNQLCMPSLNLTSVLRKRKRKITQLLHKPQIYTKM